VAPTSPEQAMEAIHRRFGAHDGHRALHAKGVLCAGSFTASPQARDLTRAAHMSGEPVPAIVRFSNGGGNPTVPDYVPDVRGLAVSFRLPDGSSTDIVAQTLPRYPFPDQEGFLDALEISRPTPRALLKLPGFAIRYPRAVAALPETQRIMGQRRGFPARNYYAFHAYRWVDADGGERFVRYQWLPTVDEPELSKDEVKRRGSNWLFDDLAERLGDGPVQMKLEVKIAGPGDDPDDPSDEWSDDCERVIVGALRVTAIDPHADDGIVFDPMRVADGVESSNDPVLRYRPAVYSLSHDRRTAR
jgi:catalase